MPEGQFEFLRLGESDLPFLLEIRNDCRAMLHDSRFFTLQECTTWFRSSDPEFYIVRWNDQRIGYFRVSNRDVETGSLYVGADLHPQFRGRGLATQAYEAFLEWIAKRDGLRAVRLEVLSHNRIARSLYDKLNFVEIARHEAVMERDGQPVDSIVMERVLATLPSRPGIA